MSEEIIRIGDEHYVHAAAAHDERTRVLKHGDTFALFDRFGNVQSLGLGDQGLYHQGTRFLCRQVLRLGRQHRWLPRS